MTLRGWRLLPMIVSLAGVSALSLAAFAAEPPPIRGRGKPFGYERSSYTIALPVLAKARGWTLATSATMTHRPLDATSKIPGWGLFKDGPNVVYLEVAARLVAPEHRHWTASMNLPEGLVERVLIAKNRPGIVRIAVRAREPITLSTAFERRGDAWVLAVRPVPVTVRAPKAVPTPMATPTPFVAPSPEPPLSTPSPEPSVVPLPEPSPEMPPAQSFEFEPEVVEAPLPEPSRGGRDEALTERGRSRLDLRRRVLNLGESYPTGGVNQLTVRDLGAWELDWSHRWGAGLESQVKLGLWESYQIQDADIPGSTHDRDSAELSAALRLERAWGPLRLTPYAGAFARRVAVRNTVEPLAPMYLFSREALFYGPELGGHVAMPLFGPIDLVASTHLRPLSLVNLESGVPLLGPLYGVGGTLGLELTQGTLVGRLDVGSEILRGYVSPFQQDFWPPQLSLSIGYRY